MLQRKTVQVEGICFKSCELCDSKPFWSTSQEIDSEGKIIFSNNVFTGIARKIKKTREEKLVFLNLKKIYYSLVSVIFHLSRIRLVFIEATTFFYSIIILIVLGDMFKFVRIFLFYATSKRIDCKYLALDYIYIYKNILANVTKFGTHSILSIKMWFMKKKSIFPTDCYVALSIHILSWKIFEKKIARITTFGKKITLADVDTHV